MHGPFQDDPGLLAGSLPSLTELDLTCNLISSWSFVEGLCTALTGLKVLDPGICRICVLFIICGIYGIYGPREA